MGLAAYAHADEPAPADAAAPTAVPSVAPPAPDATAQLIRELVAEQARLRARLEAQETRISHAEAERAATPPVLFGLGPNGFFLGTRDGNFQLRIRSVIQADGRAYLNQDQHQADTFLIRRARLYVEGTIGDHFDYRLMPDFAGGQVVLFDAWLNVRFWNFLQLRAGKFKTPFSLERLQQEQFVLFNERSLVSALAPDRDVGADVHGDAFNQALIWDLAVLDGAPDGNSVDVDNNYGKDFVVRVFTHPLRPLKNRWLDNIGLGLAYDYGKQAGTSTVTGLAAYKSGGQQTIFSWFVDPKGVTTALAKGNRWRINPQLYAYVGPVGLLGEYVRNSTEVSNGAKSATLDNQAWNVQASVVLTGERAGYDGVAPKRPFGIRKRGPGAFELAARVNQLKVDSRTFPLYADPTKSVREAFAWGLQLNWFLSRNFRFGAMYERTSFDGGKTKGFRETENALIGRLQAAF